MPEKVYGGPRWSSDGTKLVFYTYPFGLCTINSDSTGFKPIPEGIGPISANGGFSPYFSPDGKQIVMQASIDTGNWDLFKVKLDGSGLTRLTTLPEQENSPSWHAGLAPLLEANSDTFDLAKKDAVTGVSTLGKSRGRAKKYAVAAPGVFINDAGVDNATPIMFSAPKLGTVTLNADGSFVYTPNKANTRLRDNFSYQIRKGDLLSTVTTVKINLNPKAKK
jgi:hypothetical protein